MLSIETSNITHKHFVSSMQECVCKRDQGREQNDQGREQNEAQNHLMTKREMLEKGH
jgi:hypothetical protein